MFQETTATHKIKKLTKRIKAIQGGTSAGKTVATLLVLIAKAQSDTVPTLTSVVSESFPHLKRGALRDFLNILQEHRYFNDDRWNKTDSTYTFETGSKIEFFSADQPSKVRGPRRQRLFINECNNVPYETFDQLEVRTEQEIYLDWNPTNEFWFYTEVLNNESRQNDVDHIIVTYKDNEGLHPQVIQSIESRQNNTAWWRVYGLGLLGEHENRIYKNWAIVDEIPHEARLVRRYVDFGYTNDPCAIGDVYSYNGGYILDELAYNKGMSNKKIADVIKNQAEQVLVVADSSEPKSIDELKAYGLVVIGADKRNRGSQESYINWGIGLVQQQRISVTKRSVNILKEYRNYFWLSDKDGKIINTPQDYDNHHLDGIRYAIESINPQYEERPKHISKPQPTFNRITGQRIVHR